MDEEKLIQVSFQIPPSALDSLSRLAEQLRLLAESANASPDPSSRAVNAERGESGSFDQERFLALRQDAELLPVPVDAAVSEISDARVASAAISHADDAASVSASVQKELQNAKSAGDTLLHHPDLAAEPGTANGRQRAPAEEQEVPSPAMEESPANQSGKIPSVQAEAAETVPDAPEASREVEHQVPDIVSARTEAEEQTLPLAAVHGEVSSGVETPLGAGVVVQTQPEMPQSRWSNVTEELVIPGPAPLTAEAVSLAFERDGRRYDNGFPLY